MSSVGSLEQVTRSKKKSSFLQGPGLIILLGALTAFDPLTIDMYLPAFGDIRDTFQTSMANVELSVSSFFVGMALGQLFYGPFSDRFGRRKPLLAGMFLYLIATIGCAFAPNIEAFVICRFIQALGGAAGMVIARSVIRDLYDKTRVASSLSNLSLVMGLAPILAPSIGSLIDHAFGWRAIFYSLAAANFVCMLLIAKLLPDTNKNPHSELRISTTLSKYFGLLKDRVFVGYLIPDAAIRSGMFAYIAGSPFVFIELFHIPKENYGYVFGLNGLGLMLTAQINRQLLKRWSPDTILKWSVRVAALAASVVFISAWIGSSPILVLSAIFAFLCTLNFVGPNSLAGALSNHGHQAGTASSLYGCLQLSMATVSSFFVSMFHNGTAFPMTGVILFVGVFSLVSFQLLVRPQVQTATAD